MLEQYDLTTQKKKEKNFQVLGILAFLIGYRSSYRMIHTKNLVQHVQKKGKKLSGFWGFLLF
jgi:hypothetical protein